MSNYEKRWYVAHTKTNSEKRARALLEKSIQLEAEKNSLVEEMFGRLLVPEGISSNENGKSRSVVLFPGYIFIEVALNPLSESIIRNAPRISSINPSFLSEKEVENLLGKEDAETKSEIVEISCKEGDQVEIIEGSFRTMIATVEDVMPERQKIRVSVMMLGRLNSVDLDFKQVNVLNNN
jgi:transcription termination/antitermination protein NusG